MSRRNFTIASAAILSLAIAGCASEGTPQAANPTPTAAPTANSPTANSPTANSPPSQAFNHPVVAPKKEPQEPQEASPIPLTASNLIQSTNGTERVVVVQKGRFDPFAEIFGQVLPGMANSIAKPVPKLPSLSSLKSVSVVAKAPSPFQATPVHSNPQTTKITKGTSPSTKKQLPKPKPDLISVLPKVLPAVISNPTLKPVLPPTPQPELAKAVLVSGVVMLGNQLQAIVKVPDEPNSRYVQAGQKLANGLLIKRIEMNEGDNPVVIVEQYGIEVARMVGQAPSATSAGVKPVPATSPPQNPVPTGAT